MTEQVLRETIDDAHGYQGPAWLITLAGGRYCGRQVALSGRGADLILFTDPVTRSTLGLPERELTIGTVWRKLQEKRAQFRDAMNADAAIDHLGEVPR